MGHIDKSAGFWANRRKGQTHRRLFVRRKQH